MRSPSGRASSSRTNRSSTSCTSVPRSIGESSRSRSGESSTFTFSTLASRYRKGHVAQSWSLVGETTSPVAGERTRSRTAATLPSHRVSAPDARARTASSPVAIGVRATSGWIAGSPPLVANASITPRSCSTTLAATSLRRIPAANDGTASRPSFSVRSANPLPKTRVPVERARGLEQVARRQSLAPGPQVPAVAR